MHFKIETSSSEQKPWHALACLYRFWRVILGVTTIAVAACVILGAWREAPDDRGAILATIAGGLVLGAAWSTAGLYALCSASLAVNALGQSALISAPAILPLLAASVFISAQTRRLYLWKGLSPMLPRATLAILVPIRDLLPLFLIIGLVVRLLPYTNLTTLIGQLAGHAFSTFGDPLYFTTSAKLWTLGIGYLEIFLFSAPTFAFTIPSILLIQSLSIVAFVVLQYISRAPEPFHSHVFFLPGEDISSFGSLAVTLCIYFLAAFFKGNLRGSKWLIGMSAVLALLVVESWSRAAWVAGSIIIAILLIPRVSRRVLTIMASVTMILVIFVNFYAQHHLSDEDSYISRLTSLVRIENPLNKGSGRLNIYYKAGKMISDRPWMGHGLGSFYLKSVNYAKAGDPQAKIPDFAHNSLLLIAAELGVPVALSFALSLGTVLFISIYRLGMHTEPPAYAVGTAAVTYLLTQMTANSLNVYFSNQIFFWLLFSACIWGAQVGAETSSNR